MKQSEYQDLCNLHFFIIIIFNVNKSLTLIVATRYKKVYSKMIYLQVYTSLFTYCTTRNHQSYATQKLSESHREERQTIKYSEFCYAGLH